VEYLIQLLARLATLACHKNSISQGPAKAWLAGNFTHKQATRSDKHNHLDWQQQSLIAQMP
jgi:hypothetical protein